MKRIDETRLETDLGYRFEYLTEFMGFTPDDIKEIILQQAIYCGVPAANHAFKEAAAVIEAIGKEK